MKWRRSRVCLRLIPRDAEGEAAERKLAARRRPAATSSAPLDAADRAKSSARDGERGQAIVAAPMAAPARVPIARSSSPITGRWCRRRQAVGVARTAAADRRLLASTSDDRLNAGWDRGAARERARARCTRERISKLMADSRPIAGSSQYSRSSAELAWLGAGRAPSRERARRRHLGQTGSIPEAYRHYRTSTPCHSRGGGGADARAAVRHSSAAVAILKQRDRVQIRARRAKPSKPPISMRQTRTHDVGAKTRARHDFLLDVRGCLSVKRFNTARNGDFVSARLPANRPNSHVALARGIPMTTTRIVAVIVA